MQISISKLALALGMAALAQATTYAQFCDDTACSSNCGESVSTDNPGCLNESGRNSIKFHDANIQSVNLVFSPAPDCNCQNECILVVDCGEGICGGIEECKDLTGNMPAESFRFQGDSCQPNNCGD